MGHRHRHRKVAPRAGEAGVAGVMKRLGGLPSAGPGGDRKGRFRTPAGLLTAREGDGHGGQRGGAGLSRDGAGGRKVETGLERLKTVPMGNGGG